MGIERAATLYLLNSTVVDTGAGIDIRLLSAANGGTNDVTQTVTALNTNDNVERTFDPATLADTTVADATTLQKKGWGLRLADDMTPADNTNCDVFTPAQTLTVNLDVACAWTGSILASPIITFKVGLVRYNPATDAGVVWGSGSSAATTWNFLTDNGVFKTVPVSVTRGTNVAYGGGETLVLQVGLNTGTLPNPLTGSVTYTFTLRIDNNTTNIVWAANGYPHQFCQLTGALVGDGVLTRDGLAASMSDDLVGVGVLSESRAVVAAKSFDLAGDGVLSRQFAVAEEKTLVGDGTVTESRAVTATKTFDLVGDGVLSRDPSVVGLARDLVGDGVLDTSKAVVAAKTFDLVGDGTITEIHPVQAYRSFDLVGVGEILLSGPNGSTITLPLDELPTGACPADWPTNDGLKTISGTVLFHEPPNEGDHVVGAVVTLIRDSDGLLITTAVTDAAGAYTFPRDSNDPYTYHVEVRYTDVGGDQQGLSQGGCVPV